MALHADQQACLDAARILTREDIAAVKAGSLHPNLFVPEPMRGNPKAATMMLLACLLRTCDALYRERAARGETGPVSPI